MTVWAIIIDGLCYIQSYLWCLYFRFLVGGPLSLILSSFLPSFSLWGVVLSLMVEHWESLSSSLESLRSSLSESPTPKGWWTWTAVEWAAFAWTTKHSMKKHNYVFICFCCHWQLKNMGKAHAFHEKYNIIIHTTWWNYLLYITAWIKTTCT